MIYAAAYLLAIILANLSVARWGPSVAIVNAFLLIGLDLTARDHLHDAWRGRRLMVKMALLIVAGSVLSIALNWGAWRIAVASFAAFAMAATVDTVVYHRLLGRTRLLRINGSNILSAATDSLVFPALAFGFPLLWGIMAGQFIAKIGGGFAWSLVIEKWTGRS